MELWGQNVGVWDYGAYWVFRGVVVRLSVGLWGQNVGLWGHGVCYGEMRWERGVMGSECGGYGAECGTVGLWDSLWGWVWGYGVRMWEYGAECGFMGSLWDSLWGCEVVMGSECGDMGCGMRGVMGSLWG